MKAAAFRRFGGPEVLEYMDLFTPGPRPGNVVVKVQASGINRLAHYLREGSVLTDIRLPHVLGSDTVGDIAAIGAGVTTFKVGDRIVPMPGYPIDPNDVSHAPLSAAPSYAIGGIVNWGTMPNTSKFPPNGSSCLTTSTLRSIEMHSVTMTYRGVRSHVVVPAEGETNETKQPR